MESHPIPQQISSYQFRLVGDMTLKQFFQVGGGALFSLLIYSTHLHPIVKWPLVIFSFALGAALAFLPFEERPLSRWLLAFFTSVYAPTVFAWKKSDSLPQHFLPEEQGGLIPGTPLPAIPVAKTAPAPKPEPKEENLLAKMGSLFSQVASAPAAAPAPTSSVTLPQKPAGEFKIPVVPPVKIPQSQAPQRPLIIVEEKPAENGPVEIKISTTSLKPVLTEAGPSGARAVQFSSEAAPPLPPSIPNTVSGQVLDDKGKIVDGAILEIRDLAGRPVRALRSNKVGHFIIMTALQNGQYDIICEKEGLAFEPASFEAKGEIIPSMAIRAKESFEVKNAPYIGAPLIIN